MKIGICNDLINEREQLSNYCQELGYNDIFLFTSGEELLNSALLTDLNLLFLNIELEDINGICVKNRLECLSPLTFIIFITKYQELKANAFGQNVLSFLTKPINKHSVEYCIQKMTYLTKDFYPVSINNITSIRCQDILYLTSQQKYTIFYTKNGEEYSSRKSLKNWAIELEELGFCAISRSTVINLKHYMKNDGKQVILHDNITVPISRRYIQILEKKVTTYLLHTIRNG